VFSRKLSLCELSEPDAAERGAASIGNSTHNSVHRVKKTKNQGKQPAEIKTVLGESVRLMRDSRVTQCTETTQIAPGGTSWPSFSRTHLKVLDSMAFMASCGPQRGLASLQEACDCA